MGNVIGIFMKRDGMTKKEAIEHYKELREDIHECLECGGSYDDVEDILLAEELEMDYIFQFM